MPTYTRELTDRTPVGIRSRTNLLPNTGDIITALSDASDSTWGRLDYYKFPACYRTASAQAGSGERIVSVCPYVRAKMPGTKTVSATAGVLDLRVAPGTIYEGAALRLTYNNSIADYELAAHEGQLLRPGLGGEWTVDTTIVPSLHFRDPHTATENKAYWYEAGLYCYTLTPAAATADGPTGTITDTQHPTLEATIAAVVDSWQVPSGGAPFCCNVDVEWRVYLADDLESPLPSSPPDTATPVFSSYSREDIDTYIDGSTPSELEVECDVTTALGNDDYVFYVRVSREHPAGTYGWSDWDYVEFTINVAVPTAPSLSLLAADLLQRIRVRATVSATTGYDSGSALIEVERLVAGVWRDVRGMQDVAIVVGSQELVGDDYECDREVTNYYRARVSMELTADGTRNSSAWSDSAEVTGPAYTGTGWNLKAVELPAANWISAPVVEHPAESSQRGWTVFEPLDRPTPVAVSGALGGAQGSLALSVVGAEAIAALEALEAYGSTVYLETAFGDAKYIAITGFEWERLGTRSAPRRPAHIEYAEVGSGLE